MARRRNQRTANITGMPIMPAKCATCPFGPNGDADLRAMIEARLLQISQTCHSTGVIHGKADTHVCRGARDWQIQILHRIGFLTEPTDAAWDARYKELAKQTDGEG